MPIPVFVKKSNEEDVRLIELCLQAYNIPYKLYSLQSYSPADIITSTDKWVITFGAAAKTELTSFTNLVLIDLPEPNKLRRDIEDNYDPRLITHTKLQLLSDILRQSQEPVTLSKSVIVLELKDGQLELVHDENSASSNAYITHTELQKLQDIATLFGVTHIEIHKE